MGYNGKFSGTELETILDKANNLNKVSQLENDNGFISSKDVSNYSTTEKVVGVWIDGSPIYRKTFTYLDFTLPTNKWCYLREGVPELNIKQYISCSGTALCYSNVHKDNPVWQPIPRVCPDANEAYNIGFGDFDSEKVGILFGTGFTKVSVYLTIEYIKN